MKLHRLIFLGLMSLLLLAIILPGCDTLVTEKIIIVEYDSTLGIGCFECHTDDDNDFLRPKDQWENSAHATSSYLDEAGACGPQCHTHQGYIETFDNQSVSGSGYSVIGCYTCHTPHSFDYETWDDSLLTILRGTNEGGFDTLSSGDVYFLDANDRSIMCVNCHQATSTPVLGPKGTPEIFTDDWGPHYSGQADLFGGKGGFWFVAESDTITSIHAFNTKGKDGCLSCHFGTGLNYEFGEHTFRLEDDETGRQHLDNCESCHSGITDLYFAEILDTIQSRADSINELMWDYGAYNVDSSLNTSESFDAHLARVMYNYMLYNSDGSKGVHNPKYTNEILKQSIDHLPVMTEISFDANFAQTCTSQVVTFSHTSTGLIDSLYWDLGDTAFVDSIMDSTVSRQYLASGPNTVMLIAYGRVPENIDTSIIFDAITVYADLPIGGFDITHDTLGTYSFIDTSTRAINWSWDFGVDSLSDDISIERNPVYTYNDTGSYTVTQTASNPCGDIITTMDLLITDVLPIAMITFDSLPDSAYHFHSVSKYADSIFWDFGVTEITDDTSSVADVIYNYPDAITYTVTLTAYNDFGTSTVTVQVAPPSPPGGSVSPSMIGMKQR